MPTIILDCYTDEAAGLGVPPYLGVYPRYIYGYLKKNYPEEEIFYLTIDDLRLFKKYNMKQLIPKINQKTNIATYNLTKNIDNIREILENASEIIIVLGVHVPGKYLSAAPGTLKEAAELLQDIDCKKTLTGPAIYGTQLQGGKFAQKTTGFKTTAFDFTYNEIAEYAVLGAEIVKQIQNYKIIEIETGHGCKIGKCSFCTEPIKHKEEYRENEDVLKEISAFYALGERQFRIGKQTCFYSIPEPVNLLKGIRHNCPEIKTLHIDNVNPIFVNDEITKGIVKYCTPGNIAALGVESFDREVVKENCLNCAPETALKAIKTINKYGNTRGNNGMHCFLPGINLIFGLKGETKQTHEENIKYLKQILNENLLLRRINIREAAIFEGTPLYKDCGNKFLKKNKKYYWKWRNQIRQEIDFPMLQRLVPKGTIIKDLMAEIYDGNTTFLRQLGTYPLIVGVKGRLKLNEFYNIKVTGHMLRSIVGEILTENYINNS